MQLKTASYVFSAFVGIGAAALVAYLAPGRAAEPMADVVPATLPSDPAAILASRSPAVRNNSGRAMLAAANPAVPTPPPAAAATAPPATLAPKPPNAWAAITDFLSPVGALPLYSASDPVEPRQLQPRKPDRSMRPTLTPAQFRLTPLPLRPTTRPAKPVQVIAADPVELAVQPVPDHPSLPVLATAPRCIVESPIPVNPLLRLAIVVRPRPEPLGMVANPALDQMGRPPMTTVPPLRNTGAPFVKAVIPDPQEQQNAVRLANPPADNDPPASAIGQPTRPTLK